MPILRSGQLVYASAGHPPAVIGGPGGRVARLEQGGLPIGCEAGARYENAERRLAAGEFLYVFSDGAFELGRGHWSLEDLEERLCRPRRTRDALAEILSELRAVSGRGSFSDDVTILRVGWPAR